MKTETAKISLKNVRKSFQHKHVLCGINISVMPGKSLVIIGGSGSGKSVLLKSIIGLMPINSGTIIIDGQDVTHLSASERRALMYKFGVLFQGGALFDSLHVWENICFSLIQNRKISRAEGYELAQKTLMSVGLEKAVADLFPNELSGGMQKRVALARAIAAKPDIIFFDEPTTGLDPITADVINHLITKCSKELGATTVTITHDMHSVRSIADYVAMIHEGEIIWHGPVDMLDKTNNPYVEQFIHGRAEGPIKLKLQDH
jgi:phospholipid/cholesterol/gamma-HCH transport system ATP-binding protein